MVRNIEETAATARNPQITATETAALGTATENAVLESEGMTAATASPAGIGVRGEKRQ